MFGIGFPELLVVFVVALLFVGPKKLPELARTLAKGLAEFKKITQEVKEDFDISEQLASEKEDFLEKFGEIEKDIKMGEKLNKTEKPKESEKEQARFEENEPSGGTKLSG